jgi:hypothetical protein
MVDPHGTATTPEAYVARVYAAFCDAIARLPVATGMLVAYPTLPTAVWDVVAPHFGIDVDAAAQQRMAEVAKTYSKKGGTAGTAFTPDAAEKQAAASPALKSAIDTIARPALERLLSQHADHRGKRR